MQAFVPKNRRPKFELQLRIIDLNNVPLVSGTSFIKWHLPHSTAAEHRGRTPKCHIKEHKVSYDYEKITTLRLTVDKNGMLQDSAINFEVVQEYSSGARGERIALGNIKLNLAEYVEASELDDGEDGVCRRYLMQDSKINSTLKVGIRMTLLDGDRNFVAPALKTAPVFGGIAGIIAGENGETDEAGHMPSLSHKSRETGEVQDMYRRNLAAYWTAQPGELRADECIENIFAGGDGWAVAPSGPADGDATPGSGPRKTRAARDSEDGDGGRRWEGSRRSWFGHGGGGLDRKGSGRAARSSLVGKGGGEGVRGAGGGAGRTNGAHVGNGVHGRASLEQQAKIMKEEAAVIRETRNYEVDEFSLREDLRSWKLPGT